MPKAKKSGSLTVPVYEISGKEKGSLSLPKEAFSVDVNKALLAQAVRVYQSNQRQGTASTKTRGEVVGSTRKIYRQKGTGRARHGDIKAPICVHGGVAHGPRVTDFHAHMSQKMRRKALFVALSDKLQTEKIKVVNSFDGVTPKTQNMIEILGNLK